MSQVKAGIQDCGLGQTDSESEQPWKVKVEVVTNCEKQRHPGLGSGLLMLWTVNV